MNTLNRFYSFYTDRPCHWSPQSQRYAGGDALLTFLDEGWIIQGDIGYEEDWHGAARHTLLYTFTLVRRNQRVTMCVIGNPLVERVLSELPIRLVPMAYGGKMALAAAHSGEVYTP